MELLSDIDGEGGVTRQRQNGCVEVVEVADKLVFCSMAVEVVIVGTPHLEIPIFVATVLANVIHLVHRVGSLRGKTASGPVQAALFPITSVVDMAAIKSATGPDPAHGEDAVEFSGARIGGYC